MKYKLHPKYQNRMVLGALNKSGQVVNLTGKPAKKIEKNKGEPYEVEVPAATQEDLKFIHEGGAVDQYGDPIVIAVEEPAKSQKSGK